jgi:hypothetical protein
MRLLRHDLSVLFFTILLLTGCAQAASLFNTSNGTDIPAGDRPVSAVSWSVNLTGPLPGGNSVPDWSPDRQLSARIHPIHIRPAETIRPSPTPKVLQLDYSPPIGCTEYETDEDSSGGDAGAGSYGKDTALNSTGSGAGAMWVFPEGQGGSYGGLGSEITRDFKVPDCLMKSMLLDQLDDPGIVELYTSPDNDISHPSRAVLLGLTPGQYEYISRKNTEDAGFIDYCYDTNPNPYWIWVEVNTTFQTRNARPENFTTRLEVSANGAVIPAISSTDRLEPDRDYNFRVFFPVKCQQAVQITGMKLNFTQVT